MSFGGGFARMMVAAAAATGAPPEVPFDPRDLAGLVLWLDSEHTTDTGDGTTCTALIDRSATAASVVEETAGSGPTRRNANGRLPRYVDYTLGKVVVSTNGTLVNVANGAPADFTVVELSQWTGSLSHHWSWGSTSSTLRYVGQRWTSSFVGEIQQRDPTNNQAAIALTSDLEVLSPQVLITRVDTANSKIRLRRDGVNQIDATMARATTVMDIWSEGSQQRAGSSVRNCQKRRRHFLVFNRRLSDLECVQLEEWLSTQWGQNTADWKLPSKAATFGNGSNAWLLIVALGQSNVVGRALSVYPSIHAGTSSAAYCLYADMTVKELADPTGDATNSPGTMVADTPGNAAGGMFTRMVDRLRAAGETRNIMIVPCGVGATNSTAWSLLSSPPTITSLLGAAKHRITEALKAPNAELMFVMWQGEADAAVGDPVSYVTNWTAALNDLNSYFAPYLVKAHHFFVVQSPSAQYSGATPTNWTNLRNAQASLVSGRSDAVLVPAPNAGPFTEASNLHLDTGSNTPGAETGYMKLGIDMANAYLAAA